MPRALCLQGPMQGPVLAGPHAKEVLLRDMAVLVIFISFIAKFCRTRCHLMLIRGALIMLWPIIGAK